MNAHQILKSTVVDGLKSDQALTGSAAVIQGASLVASGVALMTAGSVATVAAVTLGTAAITTAACGAAFIRVNNTTKKTGSLQDAMSPDAERQQLDRELTKAAKKAVKAVDAELEAMKREMGLI